MKNSATHSIRTMSTAMLLVWLLSLGAFGTAMADTADPYSPQLRYTYGDTLQVGILSLDSHYYDSSPDNRHADATTEWETESSRVDLYTIAKLAVDEWTFLTGIRVLWDQAERKFDQVALKLKLKGDLSLKPDDAPATPSQHRSERVLLPLTGSRAHSSPDQLSFRSVFLPDKIRWHFGLDPTDSVLFGELKWGSYLALQSDLGAHQEVKMVFQYAF